VRFSEFIAKLSNSHRQKKLNWKLSSLRHRRLLARYLLYCYRHWEPAAFCYCSCFLSTKQYTLLKWASILCQVRLRRQSACQSSHIFASLFFSERIRKNVFYLWGKLYANLKLFLFECNETTIIRVAGFRVNV